jgi:membrane protein implicated in regulation of membrane protease activity
MRQYGTSNERLASLLRGRVGWLDGLLLGGFAVAALVLGLLFFTAFVALFSVLAVVGWVRWRWARRRVSQTRGPRVIEGRYTIVRHQDPD